MDPNSTPTVLLGAGFAPVWRAVARHLDHHGLEARGRVRLPAGLPATVQIGLGTLLDEPARPDRRSVDLAALETGLHRRGLTLDGVLADAGCPPAGRRERRDARLARRRERDTLLAEAAHRELGDAAWVAAWVTQVGPTLADADAAIRAVDTVARVLCAVDEAARLDTPRSRGEVASVVLGGAHRLDSGTPERRWVGKALALRAEPDADPAAAAARWDDPALWDAARLPSDLVSAPVLTWALPLLRDERDALSDAVGAPGARRAVGAAGAIAAATAAGLPVPLTMLTLRGLAVGVPPGTVVLSVENPRLLEAAVQKGVAVPMLCTSGNPRRAVRHLVRALVASGAQVRHHGDFDPAGVAITARLAAEEGVVPWRMTASDYRAAVDAAQADGVDLPPITGDVPATPWDPELVGAMTGIGLVVEEERVMDALLAEHADVT